MKYSSNHHQQCNLQFMKNAVVPHLFLSTT
jgi:hypothetical protein